MRWLVQTYGVDGRPDSAMLSIVKNWCFRNPADTSGFSFLLFCLSRFPSSAKEQRIEASSSICEEVLGLAASFKWTHESVWVFVRTLVASGDVTEDRKAVFFKTIDGLLAADPGNSTKQSILNGARDWCEKYEETHA